MSATTALAILMLVGCLIGVTTAVAARRPVG